MQGIGRNLIQFIGLICLFCQFTFPAAASIHRAPIIIKANDIKDAARYPLQSYRLFRTGPNGEAVPIPFQIDEINEIGDYVLDQGVSPNADTGNGYFDEHDELSFMGDDVGPIAKPKSWPQGNAPKSIFELRFSLSQKPGEKPSDSVFRREGAVYLGIYTRSAPPLVTDPYVVFDFDQHVIKTSRYEYRFDPQNYLVVDKIAMRSPDPAKNNQTIIRSSSFFMQADLKYFVTVKANHRSINSKLDAYRTGPVRSIVRVSFFYRFLRLNFEVGMYTEVSFFSNSVILPAVMYIPIDGQRYFNKGSNFYYGFALESNPNQYQLETNMQRVFHEESSWFEFLKNRPAKPRHYWASVLGKDQMFYLSLRVSDHMVAEDNLPRYYLDSLPAARLTDRDQNAILPLGESPVNLALHFDLTRFREGEHEISFQMFFENRRDEQLLESYRRLPQWQQVLRRL
ncbi:MAG: hypothetical protein ACOH5I_19635 [Oligoflexus sp.]